MSQNTELKAQAKKPGLNKKGIAAWINNYSFIQAAIYPHRTGDLHRLSVY